MTGILGIKKSAPSKKHKQTVSSDASQTKQTPSKSSICALYLAILIQKIGLLSVRYRTNRRVTPRSGLKVSPTNSGTTANPRAKETSYEIGAGPESSDSYNITSIGELRHERF